jgi:type II secretory pathway pseudopilin PulG
MLDTRFFQNQTGSTLVEVLVAIGLAGIMLPVVAFAVITSNNARPTATQQLTATGLLNELTEAARSVREAGWGNIATDGTYHPVISGSSWTLSSGSVTIGGFTEQIVVSDVMRDSSGDIVTSGGTVDPSTKLLTSSVQWTQPTTSYVENTMYLTRWQNEESWVQSTSTDFNADSLTNLVVDGSGQVELSPGQTSGTLESSTFDAGGDSGMNNFSFTDILPTGTNIEYQIADNDDNATWNFVGPDGTSSTYYTSAGAIPLIAAVDRYFRYEATLTTTNSNTPTLETATLTYSP